MKMNFLRPELRSCALGCEMKPTEPLSGQNGDLDLDDRDRAALQSCGSEQAQKGPAWGRGDVREEGEAMKGSGAPNYWEHTW